MLTEETMTEGIPTEEMITEGILTEEMMTEGVSRGYVTIKMNTSTLCITMRTQIILVAPDMQSTTDIGVLLIQRRTKGILSVVNVLRRQDMPTALTMRTVLSAPDVMSATTVLIGVSEPGLSSKPCIGSVLKRPNLRSVPDMWKVAELDKAMAEATTIRQPGTAKNKVTIEEAKEVRNTTLASSMQRIVIAKSVAAAAMDTETGIESCRRKRLVIGTHGLQLGTSFRNKSQSLQRGHRRDVMIFQAQARSPRRPKEWGRCMVSPIVKSHSSRLRHLLALHCDRILQALPCDLTGVLHAPPEIQPLQWVVQLALESIQNARREVQ